MSNNYKLLSKKMGQQSTFIGQKLLNFFFENPGKKSTVRGLAKQIGISRSTAQYYLSILRKENFVSKENKWVDNWQNRLIKTNYFLERIAKSGVIDYLEEELAASAIILFGSMRKGESTKDSDIDIFVECAQEKKMALAKYERILGHKIQLFIKPKITLLPKHLLNNVVNGIKIKGHFTIK